MSLFVRICEMAGYIGSMCTDMGVSPYPFWKYNEIGWPDVPGLILPRQISG